MDNSRLSTRILGRTCIGFGSQNKYWVQFVNDHKRYIRQNSDIQTFNTYDLLRYRYRPEEFFKDKASCSSDTTWIYLLVNDIRSPEEFNTSITRLWMPTYSLIEQLRKSYEQAVQMTV